MVVFLFNSVIYVSLLLCLCILIVCLCTFIVMYMLYYVSLRCFVYCLCVNVYLQLPPGLNPIAANKIKQYHIITPSPSSVCAGDLALVLPDYQHTLKMGMELGPDTSENLHILMRLPAREYFIISQCINFPYSGRHITNNNI